MTSITELGEDEHETFGGRKARKVLQECRLGVPEERGDFWRVMCLGEFFVT